MEKLKIGVNTCLLGLNVLYNGGHQLNHFIRDILGQYMDFVPVCLEVECGMPIPRETLRLTGSEGAPRLVTSCKRLIFKHHLFERREKTCVLNS